MELKGRRRIFTDATEITRENVITELQTALTTHEANRAEIAYLLNFDKGEQPLVREKTVRSDIDIKSIANIANEITEFKLGYFWGNPVAMVQKSDKLPKGSDKNTDNSGISVLNDMYYAEQKDSKDIELARYVEICGVGYQMIDIKRNPQDGDAPFDLITLNPLYTFVVYSSDVYHRPMMGVTYVIREDYTKMFTVITDDAVYIIDSAYKIKNGKQSKKQFDYFEASRSGEANPLGEVYIVEYNRSYDRTGCFERQIDELNAYNVLKSDFVNDVAQNTQAIWWGNDIELIKDETTGEVKGVQGGQWILTKTFGDGHKCDIKPLTLQYDYTGVLNNISASHDEILERAFTPRQSDPGGGSTGSAMSMSSGWSAAESVACKEALVLKKSFQHRNSLALKAIRKSPMVEQDSPVLTLASNDIEIRFVRQKTYDLATKVNALATMIQNQINPRVAMSTVDLFSNLAEAVDDSEANIEKYQNSLIKSDSGATEKTQTDTTNPDSNRTMQDMSDQTDNSPILKNQ